MPKPFVALTLDQFRALLERFPFSRRIDMVHMHHTFRPNHAQFRGIASIEAMFEFHTRERKFADIAQHITIAPDGKIFTGRNWNDPPASAAGHNGNNEFGPFMVETVGDFDIGNDPFQDPQRETVLQVIAAVQKRFSLPPDALRFHRQMANKSCPGSGVQLDAIVQAIGERHQTTPGDAPAASDERPFNPSFREDTLTSADRETIQRALDVLTRGARAVKAESDAEVPESDQVIFTSTGAMTSAAARGVEITATDLVALRPHVIDLNEGMLTEGGVFSSLPEDVERIFGEDMEQAFKDPRSVGMPARADGDPFRIVIWAHGGLIGEQAGLAIAHKHLKFWKSNGIYPVYFVWETGLLQTIGHLLRGIIPGARDMRNFFSDSISDPLLEATARAAGGEKIWSGMKRNAELAAIPAGGATKAAHELKKFCDRHGGAIELHAAGHSAGSIFHAHFLPVAFDRGVPDVAALHLLAPAIRVDTFKDRLLPLMGNRIRHTNLFTMVKEKERDDNCAGIYRKSLLYLIRFSLEKDRDAEILGLEESLRRNRDLARAFGLGGSPASSGEAIFSPTVASDGVSATASLTHGGFDDDAPTMNSIALRTLGAPDKSHLRMPYPEGTRDLLADPWQVPEVVELQRSFAATVVPSMPSPESVVDSPLGAAPLSHGPAVLVPGKGTHRALCVGIDRYPVRPLAGCVADARLWGRTLQQLGFQCDLLLDRDATYAAIRRDLERLITTARSGDVIVWQYSGHGTRVPDVNGDEEQGDSPGEDEAICPVDMKSGKFFVDDEIGALTERLPAGVQFTMFIDCCHSGTINRFGFGEAPSPSSVADERARFLPLTDDLKEAYLQFAAGRTGSRAFSSRNRNDLERRNEVLFSACLSTEVAWESNGQGEFTVRATRLLAQRGLAMTNEAFMQQVIAAFGPNARQTPNLVCAKPLRSRGLLQPVHHAGARTGTGKRALEASADGGFGNVAAALDMLAGELHDVASARRRESPGNTQQAL